MLIRFLWHGKEIKLTSDNTTITSNNFNVDRYGNMTCNNANVTGTINSSNGTIGGFTLGSDSFSGTLSGLYDYNYYDHRGVMCRIMDWIASNNILDDIWDATGDGDIRPGDSLRILKILNGTAENTKYMQGIFQINTQDPKNAIVIKRNGELAVSLGLGGINTNLLNALNIICGHEETEGERFTGVTINGDTGAIFLMNESSAVIYLTPQDGNIRCVSVTQTSKEEDKKNFEKLQNGLDIVKATDIYKYNLKLQKDGDKKHIGFVIGDNYKYSEEITSANNDGVDNYSMISVAYKAIQEQQEQIEQLQEEIKELKGEK